MQLRTTLALTLVHLLSLSVCAPLPDAAGSSVFERDTGAVSAPDVFSSSVSGSQSAWTNPTVAVGTSIQQNDNGQDVEPQTPSFGTGNTRRAPNDLFGPVDSSMGTTRSTQSTSEANEVQRQEQEAVRRPPPGGFKVKREPNDLFGSVDGSMGSSRPVQSTSEANEMQRQEQEAVRRPPPGGY